MFFQSGTWGKIVKDIEAILFVFSFALASEMERLEKEWTDSVGQNHFAGLVLIAGDGFHNHGTFSEYQGLLKRGEIQLTKVYRLFQTNKHTARGRRASDHCLPLPYKKKCVLVLEKFRFWKMCCSCYTGNFTR